jgi:hypothetical protein
MLKSSVPGPLLIGKVDRNASVNSQVSSPTSRLPPIGGRSLSPTIVSAMPSVPDRSIVSPLRTSLIPTHSTAAWPMPVSLSSSPGVIVHSSGSGKNSSPSHESWATTAGESSKTMRALSPASE